VRLPFELDPQIIHHIIYSQAGSIGKAIIELLMNAADANATRVLLRMSKTGFECRDDGNGFATRDDVLRYFGRFGTPHQEGDATYGRFRLGRGQIMAHATTDWRSNSWRMQVDTRTMGYSYDLDELAAPIQGCEITGSWYEPFTDAELQSSLQEIRDLVRYTPVSVELNGHVITRNPAAEKWDHADEYAYYRVKEDGAVSIYNQGVLVRHDPAGLWGAGGLIVSKKAIGLNVSRTEILRKTCPVWKPIAKHFGKMAEEMAAHLGDHRKTEARREKNAKALLSGDPRVWDIFDNEEVITILPGKRHVTLRIALQCLNRAGGALTVVERPSDVPKGESIAKEGIALVVHSKTMERFGCYSPTEFKEALERVFENLGEAAKADPAFGGWNTQRFASLKFPTFIAFCVLKKSFVERTQIVTEVDALDKETRRAWTALRWCIRQYAGACLGEAVTRSGRLSYRSRRAEFRILLGDSNSAEAWTDGRTYIAISLKNVQRLRTEPLRAVSYIFSLVEHEVAHEGDSLACGHDEAFYQRYHDISIRMAAERQRYIHIWLAKYTRSLEYEGKPPSGDAWRERMLVDRAGTGRKKRELGPVIEDLANDALVTANVPTEEVAFISQVNVGLVQAGLCPRPADWSEIVARALLAQAQLDAEFEAERSERATRDSEYDQYLSDCKAEATRIATSLNIAVIEIGYDDVERLWGLTGTALQEAWTALSAEFAERHGGDDDYFENTYDATIEQAVEEDPLAREALEPELRELANDGETMWSLGRNAAAAGFIFVPDYLRWRKADQACAALERRSSSDA